MKKILALLLIVACPLRANALEIFACEPEWGSLVTEIAGELANVTVATTAFQDPHSLQARPSLIAAVRQANLLVCTGADLEVGWLPLLLRRSGNPKIQPGSPGYFLAADYVRRIEVPKTVDRSQGDVHPQGNPHIHLNPRNVLRVAEALAGRLAEVDSSNAGVYLERFADFLDRWDRATDRWAEKSLPLEGLRLASHHRSFSYLADWLNLDIVATLESKPGVPPSGAQLARILEQLTPNPPAGVIRTPYENEKPSNWLSSRLGIPAIMLPFTVGATDEVVDLFSLYDAHLDMLLEYVN